MARLFPTDPITPTTFDSSYDIFPDYLPGLRLNLQTNSHHNLDTAQDLSTKVKTYTT